MIKIQTGFREDQYCVINDEEAHKAYYLFNNPNARTVFSNGVAIIGKNIQSIEPAYNETMGWKPTHKLDEYDWEELNSKGIPNKLRNVLSRGKEIAELAIENNDESILKLPLSEISERLYLE